jgi:hypothetical protein
VVLLHCRHRFHRVCMNFQLAPRPLITNIGPDSVWELQVLEPRSAGDHSIRRSTVSRQHCPPPLCPTFSFQFHLLSRRFVPASPCPASTTLSNIYKNLVPHLASFDYSHPLSIFESCKHSVLLSLNPTRDLIHFKMENIIKEGEQMMDGGNNNNQGQSNDNQSYGQSSNNNQSSNEGNNQSSNEGNNQQQSSGNSSGGGFMSGMKQNTEDAYINNGRCHKISQNH